MCRRCPPRPRSRTAVDGEDGGAVRLDPRLRRQVLEEEPWCPGYPADYHRGALVHTTSVDHIRPRVRGGTHDRQNLRGLCGPCNSRKSVDEGASGGPGGWRNGR